MKRIKTYSEMLNDFEKFNILNEKAMNPDRIQRIKRLKDSGDYSNVLKEFKPIIDKIKKLCFNLNYDDILYKKSDESLEFYYSDEIVRLLTILKLKSLSIDEETHDSIFNEYFTTGLLQIELDSELLNRIDIINHLPLFMKNLGIGKKIYKILIKDYNYISSFNGYEPSIDSSMVWESLANDNELYIFLNDNNLICFWNDYDYENIINVLKEFYSNKGNREFDDDFLKRYNLDDVKMNKLFI